jgi:hypothetical protein
MKKLKHSIPWLQTMVPRKLLKYFIIIGIAIYVSIFVIEGVKDANLAQSEMLPPTYLLSSEDSNLFAKAYLNRISVNQISHTKNRDRMAFLSVDKQYTLILHSIDLNQDLPLKSLLQVDNQNVHQSTGVTYSVTNGSNSMFRYRTNKILPVSLVYLTISDPPQRQIISNDSLLSYHLFCSNLSIRYAKELPIDLFMAGKKLPFGNYEKILIELLIWKHNAKLYIFFLKARKDDVLPLRMLYDLVNVTKPPSLNGSASD